MTPNPMEFRRPDPGNESVIDPHARFNGKYVSDRDLRIEGEASGEIECSGTLIISPQAKVRSSITAANVIINGDYEGDVDCGGRFEIGSTGRVKARSRTQVLVVKEGAPRGRRDDDARGPRLTPKRRQPATASAPPKAAGAAHSPRSRQVRRRRARAASQQVSARLSPRLTGASSTGSTLTR